MGTHCPFDGWSSKESHEIACVVKKLEESGTDLSINTLKLAGLSDAALNIICVVEFASKDISYDSVQYDGLSMRSRVIKKA